MIDFNVSLNLNVLTVVTIDVLRDGQSILGGPKLYNQTANPPNLSIFVIQSSSSLFFVDKEACKGTHNYTVVIANASLSVNNTVITRYALQISFALLVRISHSLDRL